MGDREPSTGLKIVDSYNYVDENDQLLFQVVRLEPKSFRQRRPDGKGGWLWSRGGLRRVLYRLPAIRPAIDRRETIFLVEGEKDVHSLERIGLVATTNPGGTGKWRPEYTEMLRGTDVVLIGDHDDAGRDHVALVAAALHGIARRVLVLDLGKVWPECPHKGDVSDWLATGGGTAAVLAAVVQALSDWQPAAIPSDNDGDTAEGVNRSGIEAAEIARLAKLSAFNYERERDAAAERLGVRTSVLDRVVKAERSYREEAERQVDRPLYPHWAIEPSDEAVDGGVLLQALVLRIRRHVVMDEHQATAVALWIMMSWVHARPRGQWGQRQRPQPPGVCWPRRNRGRLVEALRRRAERALKRAGRHPGIDGAANRLGWSRATPLCLHLSAADETDPTARNRS